MEIAGIGGRGFAQALAAFCAGTPVTYRGMTLALHRAELEVRVPVATSSSADAADGAGAAADVADRSRPGAPAGHSAGSRAEPVTARRALDQLTSARYRLGALLASAPPLDAAVGNRRSRLLLVDGSRADAELYELSGDRLRRLPG